MDTLYGLLMVGAALMIVVAIWFKLHKQKEALMAIEIIGSIIGFTFTFILTAWLCNCKQ